MKFTRAEYLGLDLPWYAVDAIGHLAVLMTGYGAIPKTVFADQASYNFLDEYFEARPEQGQAGITDDQAELQRRHNLNFDSFEKDARRGLFSYFHRGNSASEPYELIAYPLTPLNFDQLPEGCRSALKFLSFEAIHFDKSHRLNVAEYFACD